ncbi:MAG: hypothetical protein DHS20C20_07580 [Ardenticatenaceae bacterium]|nr:MAG: hypothetical protein DHS20C20_07580 [Ardenticatenaceae bacterium]
MGWYYDYKPTIQTDEGIKAKSKRGDFVKNWWATRWIAAMERVMDRGRLQRGRRYARKGQVLSLEEGKGQIKAKVQGSRRTPYKITIALEPLSEKDWGKVLAALAERPYFVAQLLAGEMPQEIEEAFRATKLELFPGRRELKQHCNCPDSAAVCKHLAAVHYILAERFDEDPFLLFRLRGKTQDEVLAVLGDGLADENTAVPPEYSPAPPLSASLNNYWQTSPELENFSVHITPSQEPYPLLERLGDPDFFPDARRWLVKAFDVVSETAVQIAFQPEEAVNETE